METARSERQTVKRHSTRDTHQRVAALSVIISAMGFPGGKPTAAGRS